MKLSHRAALAVDVVRALVGRRVWLPGRQAACPHPGHRLRHIHGDERNYGYVAQCMECGRLYRDWPGGDHDATQCRTGLR